MSLLSCTDCHQPVSSKAHACPTCGRLMRDRSYLTPMGQVVVGGIVLIACLAWQPMFLIVALVAVGRLVSRAGRGGTFSAVTAAGFILATTVTLMYTFSNFSLIVLVMGLAAAAWLVAARFAVAVADNEFDRVDVP